MPAVTDKIMSGLTNEWHLKRENGIKYWVDIEDFRKKMNWRPGRRIFSRPFKLGESVFTIDIFPNGNTPDFEGHVSVFLNNQSSWRVRTSDSYKVGGHEMVLEDHYHQPGQGWGSPGFLSHDKIEEEDLLDEDRFTLEVNVDLLEEEVLASRPRDCEGDAVLSLKREVFQIQEDLKREVRDMREEFSQGLAEMKTKIDSSLKRPLTVECPVCMEEVKPPMRLRHCGEGEIITYTTIMTITITTITIITIITITLISILTIMMTR